MTTERAGFTAGRAGDQELDAAQFQSVFVEYWPRIHRVLARLVGDADEAQDLALETFWRLYAQPPTDRRSNLGGWLYRVATNLGLNSLRARLRRTQHEQTAEAFGLAAQEAGDPVESMAIQEARAQAVAEVRRVLGEMRAQHAQLLLLRQQGLSYRQLAEALGVAPGSIGPLLVRAEQEFQAKYRERGS